MTEDILLVPPASSIMLAKSGGSGGVKILLVEDKDSLRQMLSTAIKKAGYAVDEAADGTGGEARLGRRGASRGELRGARSEPVSRAGELVGRRVLE